jgi:hypothetical protein
MCIIRNESTVIQRTSLGARASATPMVARDGSETCGRKAKGLGSRKSISLSDLTGGCEGDYNLPRSVYNKLPGGAFFPGTLPQKGVATGVLAK